MTRWTVYDSKTGESVGANLGSEREVVEDPSDSADALSSALSDAAAVAVLPARTRDCAVVLTMKRCAAPQYEPTGFLGVHDQIVSQPPSPRQKPWWRRLLT